MTAYTALAHRCDSALLLGQDAYPFCDDDAPVISTYDAALAVGDESSFCMRVYLIGHDDGCPLLTFREDDDSPIPYSLYLNSSSDILYHGFTHAGGTGAIASGINIDRNVWKDIVVRASASGNYVKFNVGGAYASISRGTTNVVTTSTSCKLRIGCTNTLRSSLYWRDVAIYNRLLTDTEVSLYIRGGKPEGPNWSISGREASGKWNYDLTRHRNNLDITNCDWITETTYDSSKVWI